MHEAAHSEWKCNGLATQKRPGHRIAVGKCIVQLFRIEATGKFGSARGRHLECAAPAGKQELSYLFEYRIDNFKRIRSHLRAHDLCIAKLTDRFSALLCGANRIKEQVPGYRHNGGYVNYQVHDIST